MKTNAIDLHLEGQLLLVDNYVSQILLPLEAEEPKMTPLFCHLEESRKCTNIDFVDRSAWL